MGSAFNGNHAKSDSLSIMRKLGRSTCCGLAGCVALLCYVHFSWAQMAVPNAQEQPGKQPTPLPMPMPVDQGDPNQIHLPTLCAPPTGLGTIPRPTKEVIEEFNKFVKPPVDPRNILDVVIGQPRLLPLAKQPIEVHFAPGEKEPAADVQPASKQNPLLYYVIGKKVGTGVLNIFFPNPDPNKANEPIILSYLVRVLPDIEAGARVDNIYKALAERINRLFPDSVVQVARVGDKLVVSGQAKDAAEAVNILRIVRSNAPATREEQFRNPLAVTETTTNTGFNLVGAQTQTESVQATLENFQVAGGPNVINLLHIPGEQQVMLKIVVAEINRTAARTLGVDFTQTTNSTTFSSNLTGVSTAGGASTGASAALNSTSGANILLTTSNLNLQINALKNLNLARSLAEPSLLAINGQSGRFTAGGEFPVPQVTGFTAAGLEGVQFVPFGVQMSFTPYITDKDRVRLVLNGDISTKDLTSSANVGGTNVPGLNSRTFQTTAELREGQTLAIAGLIQTNYSANAVRVPFFGEIPFIGRIFANDSTQSGEQELVVLITPKLVHPLEPHDCPPLPGADVFEPNDVEFYLMGRLESHRAEDFRGAVRTDLSKMKRYYHCEDEFIIGPQGHSLVPRDGH